MKPSLVRSYLPSYLRALSSLRISSVLWGVLALLMCFKPESGEAQFNLFAGAMRPVAFGFSAPGGVAVDQYGNLFVADSGTFYIYEILAVNGSIPPNPTVRKLYQSRYNPWRVAVDGKGNVFFTDLGSPNTIKELLAVNGQIPLSPTVVEIGAGFGFSSELSGIVVDANGNVFVSDLFNSAIYKIVAVNGSIPASPTIITLGSGFQYPAGVAVDASGNVYVADWGNQAVKEILAVNGSIPSTPVISTIANNYYDPNCVALDQLGNVYFSSYYEMYKIHAVGGSIPAQPAIEKFSAGFALGSLTSIAVDANQNVYAGSQTGWAQVPQVFPSGFGPVSVGTVAPSKPLLFIFPSTPSIGSISVVTKGTSALDFQDAGTGTCPTGSGFSSGYFLCTVDVQFAPTSAGLRSAAVIIKDPNGNVIDTGYAFGTGVAPQINFVPPTQTTAFSSLPPTGLAIDGSGNIYFSSTARNQVIKETLSAGTYIESVLPTSALNSPGGIAVDGGGSIYIADTGNNRVLRETPSGTGYIESIATPGGIPAPVAVALSPNGTIAVGQASGQLEMLEPHGQSYYSVSLSTGLASISGIAAASDGSFYVASSSAPGMMLKETQSGPSFTPTPYSIPSDISPSGITVDAFDNVYLAYTGTDGTGQIAKLTPSSGGFTQAAVPFAGLSQPGGMAVDSFGNFFVADSGTGQIAKLDYVDAPSLSFISTTVGTRSADSPKTVTLVNIGNADIEFPIPASGNNPSITTGFVLDENAPSACPVTGSGFSSPSTLAAGSSCLLPMSFSPTAAGNISGSLLLTDNNFNAAVPGYAIQSISLNGTATQATSVITWPNPAAITYGTPLSATQLNATANAPGTFSYAPAAGAVLGVGTQRLTTTFTPTDPASYTSATATVSITVNKATPAITWPAPPAITYGTALSASLLNATANVPGTFSYSPAAGTVLGAGAQALTVIFTPTDTTNYATATAGVQLIVNKATPILTWPTPSPIYYGTALSGTQLNATANVPGTFAYSPAAGTVLPAGTNTLKVTFTPTDTVDYNSANASALLIVKAPDFSITASPASVSLKQGGKATTTITISPIGAFTNNVSLSASGLPKGVSVSFSPNPAKTSSTVTFSANGSASLATSSVTITGNSGSLTHTTLISLTVTHK